MPASRPNGRPRISCAQCRHSKIKCDKVFPCSQCVRHGCQELCPDGIRQEDTSTSELLKQVQELKREVAQLRRRNPTPIPLNISPNPMAATTSHLAGPSMLASQTYSLNNLPSQPSIGHLSVDPGEGSRFLGPTAAAHLLPAEDEESGVVALAARDATRSTLRMEFPFLSANSTSAFLQARAKLPSVARCLQLRQTYFEQTTWRFGPVSRQYCDGVFHEVVSNDETSQSRQPAQLAMVFGILAVGCLFDSSVPAHSPEAKSYHELSLHCLGLADFLSHISTPTLVSLHLHCCFLINDDRPRAEEIYAIVGLALRLAIIAGFHKDGSWWGLPEDETNARRRIWWEILTLERINSNRFGCPPFIQADRFDAIPPMDEPADGFIAWRWEWDNCLERLINVIQGHLAEGSNVEQKNEILRSYWSRLPTALKSGVVDQAERVDLGRSLDTLEQIRLALHYSTGLLQCHRSSFQQSLKTHPNEPLESPSSQSVLAVIAEACPSVVKLVEELFQGHGVSYTRHIVAALDLFSAIVPLAAIVIRSPRSGLSINAHGFLLRGMTLLELASEATPCPWYSMLLARGKSMASKATTRLARRWDPPTVPSSPLQAPVIPLGDMVDPIYPDLDPSESDFDFDQWLNSLWDPLAGEQPGFQA